MNKMHSKVLMTFYLLRGTFRTNSFHMPKESGKEITGCSGTGVNQTRKEGRGREYTGSKVFQEVCFFGEVAQVQEPHGGKQDDS